MDPEESTANNSHTPKNRICLAKVIFAILFIIMPFIGFWAGTKYQGNRSQNIQSIPTVTSYEECLQTLDTYMYPAVCTAPDGTKWPAPTNTVKHPIAPSPTQSILNTTCSTDQDCKLHLSYGECKAYCGSTDKANDEIINNRTGTCDPTLWDPPFEQCVCANNICQIQEKL